MQAWGSSRTVRAAVLRDILRGRLAQILTHTGCGCGAPASPASSTWRT
jgi:hypothetical protein